MPPWVCSFVRRTLWFPCISGLTDHEWSQIWRMYSWWYSAGFINFKSRPADLPLFPELGLVWQFLRISLRCRIMGVIASQITSLTIFYSTVYSDADQRKHQSSVSLAFVRGIHRGPVNSPHKWPITRKMLPFDDVVMSRQTTDRT